MSGRPVESWATVGALDATEAEAAFIESFRARWDELTGGCDDEDC